MTRFAFAAAGTGGHVYPALHVAEALVAAGVARDDIVFLGGDRLEATAVPAAGYELVQLPLQGLVRAVTWRNLRIPFRLVAAVRRAGGELARRGTRALAAFGGYVTVPAALAARRRRVPLFLQEQNGVPGLGNRAAARWARRVYLGLPAAAGKLPGEVIGNPLRREIDEFDREALRPEALRRYGLPADRFVLGVVGGSLGAQAVNEAIVELVSGWSGPPLAVVHVAGPAQAEKLRDTAADGATPWRVLPFEADMQYFYAVANLIVCRSSGVVTSELAATGSPSVLVPRAVTRAGHYEANAADLVGAGAAEIVREDDLGRLPARVAALAGNAAALATMAAAAGSRARLGAADRIAADLLEAAGG